jgi:hypothetical protein
MFEAESAQARQLLASGAKMPEIEALLTSKDIPPEVAREIVIQVIEQNVSAQNNAKKQEESAVRLEGFLYVALGITLALLGAAVAATFRGWYLWVLLFAGGLTAVVRGILQMITSREIKR